MSDKKNIVSASPKVRKLARELGADMYQIQGTQREGRVSEGDVKTFIKESISGKVEKKQTSILQQYDHSEFGEIDVQPIPRIKKIAGPHLQKSWNEIPHVTQHDEADITEMEKFRKSLRDLYTGEKISITPLAFIMRAVVKALKDYPNFNSSLDAEREKIIYKKYFHIGIAVDTPHGLMVPKIRDVDKKDITELGKELKRVSKLSKELKIDKKEFFGGSMTISSLGGIGGSFFTPIINQPEVAILGVGKAETKQVFVGDKYENRIMLPLSLSYDHRVIDGAEGARFCVHLKESLGKDFAYKLAV
jgi:pyruvate dehydrogenase E2 component (dihydrolipoamide acetyltransferase)|tara:strand:- start:141 stop:1052 length:912 start_codon:yes stop_codon:yes gene_type:complete